MYNRKKAIEETNSRISASPARQLTKNEFSALRLLDSHRDSVENLALTTKNSADQLPPANLIMTEAHNYLSQPPNEFYSNHKVKYKPLDLPDITALANDYASSFQSSFSQPASPVVNRNKVYQYSTPDYLRIPRVNSRSCTRKKLEGDAKQPITVISKVSGWLTVDPETLSRKNAIEKDQKINIRNTSKAAPQWMIIDKSRDEERFRLFKPTPVVGHNVAMEPKRVLLIEANPPKRTIFNGGFSRMEDASTGSKRATLA